jgi:hypothetical protein
MSELSPRDTFKRISDYWWLLATLMLAGGLAAWLAGQFLTPIYEATAFYDVTLDQAMIAARLHIDPATLAVEYTIQNTYLEPVEALFYDPDIRAAMIADANTLGIRLDLEQLSGEDFSVDRTGVAWFITVRNTNPITAARLANLWVTDVDAALREAQSHSLQAFSLQAQRDAVMNCFNGQVFSQANLCAGTSFTGRSDLEAYLNDLQQQFEAEKLASRDIDLAVSFNIMRLADPPSEPALYNLSYLMVAGSLIGLLAGLLLVQVMRAKLR